jgi:8-oxo-dGTP diphosphatase
MERPGVGLGVYIIKDGKVLLGKRKSAHGEGTWCAPGGHLEFGETWEECAQREVKEETGLSVKNLRFVGLTNDIFDESKHYVTIAMFADWKSGVPRVMEPDKCEKWEWFEWGKWPKPLFLATRNFIKKGYNPLKI